jgi:hypothetical protein
VRICNSGLSPIEVDSDRAVAVAFDYGGRDFLASHPDARTSLDIPPFALGDGARHAWQIRIWTLQAPCGFAALVDARTGELLSASPACP